ncbi:hypothetical protein [Butyricimonas virosa]|uniref:hypothetical protein n=1 Tax=Butyricimonas virosa TaxID=544645 RepID=UPI003AAF2FFF
MKKMALEKTNLGRVDENSDTTESMEINRLFCKKIHNGYTSNCISIYQFKESNKSSDIIYNKCGCIKLGDGEVLPDDFMEQFNESIAPFVKKELELKHPDINFKYVRTLIYPENEIECGDVFPTGRYDVAIMAYVTRKNRK